MAYPEYMKPTVPETGTIIRIEGENAVIQLKSGGPCKGCGKIRGRKVVSKIQRPLLTMKLHHGCLSCLVES